jgi:hypothetical protein
MAKIMKTVNGWAVVESDGSILFDGLSNAEAWRKLDIIQLEPVSASQVSKEMKDFVAEPSISEKQDFFSALIQIGIDRGYSSGWAWHKFYEKYGHTPEGLHRNPCKPSKKVWGWVNRKAIARSRGK